MSFWDIFNLNGSIRKSIDEGIQIGIEKGIEEAFDECFGALKKAYPEIKQKRLELGRDLTNDELNSILKRYK